MNDPNKLECFIKLRRKGFQVTNTQAYLAHLQVTKKMKCYKCDSMVVVFTTLHFLSNLRMV
jgi:hypothetical protein